MHALITGATGFAGHYLVRELLREEWTVTALARDQNSLPPSVPFLHRDLADLTSRDLRDLRPDVVFHLAGFSSVSIASSAPHEVFQVNSVGTSRLFYALDDAGIRARVVVISSGNVYAPADHPAREEDPILPVNPYAASKICAESLALAWARRGMDVVLLRPFNHIGPGQATSFVAPAVADQIARAELGLTEPVLHIGDLTPVRDFTDVRDVARGYRLAALRGESGAIYNLSSDRGVSIDDLISEFRKHATVRLRIQQDDDRKRSDARSIRIGCSDLFRRRTGWFPRIPLSQTVEDLLRHHRMLLRSSPTGKMAGVRA